MPTTDQIILSGLAGSRSYGLHTVASDYDLMTVVVGADDVYLGLQEWGSRGTKQAKSDHPVLGRVESTSYELKKFLLLCQKFSPSAIPLLWVDRYFIKTPAGDLLVQNRRLFNSKQAYASLAHYAEAQLRRMGSGATGRMGRQRKELREQYGFDCKYGAHTIRLLRMCVQFLESDGADLGVARSADREYLLDVRNGKYSVDYVLTEAGQLLDRAREAVAKTTLPEQASPGAVNALCKAALRLSGVGAG